MAELPLEEVRRLVSYLRARVNDPDRLIEIEGELQGEEAEEFLREPELLAYFPTLTEEAMVIGLRWRLRVIPHAHLRMVQRGIKTATVVSLFSRFVEKRAAERQPVTVGKYTIRESPTPHGSNITLRVDVDAVESAGGQAHVVTVFMGREPADTIEIK